MITQAVLWNHEVAVWSSYYYAGGYILGVMWPTVAAIRRAVIRILRKLLP